MYPVNAVREGLVNALVHRDYSSYSGSVHVFVCPERLVIRNSGQLPEGVAVKQLGSKQVSVLRNPDIAHIMHLRGYMEKIGRGNLLITELCKEKGMKEPVWTSGEEGVSLTLFTEGPRKDPLRTPEAPRKDPGS